MNLTNTITKAKLLSQHLAKVFIFTFVCIYFGYHLVSGQNGVLNYFKQKAKLEKLETELSIVTEKRDKLSNKVHKLYPESLDADLLDEQYRRTTGKIKQSEAIYYYE